MKQATAAAAMDAARARWYLSEQGDQILAKNPTDMEAPGWTYDPETEKWTHEETKEEKELIPMCVHKQITLW
jgi:hypothetical protein